jgi:hypothetical protein
MPEDLRFVLSSNLSSGGRDPPVCETIPYGCEILVLLPATLYGIEEIDILAVHHFRGNHIVCLWVSRRCPRKWLARVKGYDVDSGTLLTSYIAACRHTETTFTALFPEHQCSRQCLLSDHHWTVLRKRPGGKSGSQNRPLKQTDIPR